MELKKRQQVFRDPLYGYIHIDYDFLTDLIDTPVFQRLRRIRQLSGVNMIFHGAEHTRFSHSLGAYELAYKFLQINSIKNALDERESLLFLTSALLHDIGHGPYSHAFEHTFDTDHEVIGALLVLKNPEIRSILDQVDQHFAEDIAGILLGKGKHHIIEQLVSSQLDVDRLDYLERDAFYTGVVYGHVDVDRLMRIVDVVDHQVVFKQSGIHAIENYLMSRYHMYWQVYFHPKARAYEIILEKIYQRVKDLIQQDFKFNGDITYIKAILKNPDDLEAFLRIDDFYMNGLISTFQDSHDDILQTLANDFLNRRLWEYLDFTEANVALVEKKFKDCTQDEKTYFIAFGQQLSKPAYTSKKDEEIMILTTDKKVIKLSQFSSIIHSLISSSAKLDRKIFYRKM